MDGRMRGGGSGVCSWLVTVIIVLAVLQLHVTVGVAAGRQMPRQLLHESCLKVWIVAIIFLKDAMQVGPSFVWLLSYCVSTRFLYR